MGKAREYAIDNSIGPTASILLWHDDEHSSNPRTDIHLPPWRRGDYQLLAQYVPSLPMAKL